MLSLFAVSIIHLCLPKCGALNNMEPSLHSFLSPDPHPDPHKINLFYSHFQHSALKMAFSCTRQTRMWRAQNITHSFPTLQTPPIKRYSPRKILLCPPPLPSLPSVSSTHVSHKPLCEGRHLGHKAAWRIQIHPLPVHFTPNTACFINSGLVSPLLEHFNTYFSYPSLFIDFSATLESFVVTAFDIITARPKAAKLRNLFLAISLHTDYYANIYRTNSVAGLKLATNSHHPLLRNWNFSEMAAQIDSDFVFY